MKKSISCSHPPLALVALAAVLGLTAFVQSVSAEPVTVTLDNPHQTIARPTSGILVLSFTGTVSFGADFEFEEAILDVDYNRSSTEGVPTFFGPLDFSKANDGGSVSGILFTATISASTTPGLYGFHFGEREAAVFSIEGTNGLEFVTQSIPFSIRVTDGKAVPDTSGTAPLLGLSLVAVFLLQRKLDRPVR